MNLETSRKNLLLHLPKTEINMHDTLDCGQCFRWKVSETEPNVLIGIVFDRVLRLSQNEQYITFYDTTLSDFNLIWRNYFDLETDYSAIKQQLSFDETIRRAIEYAGGIRILKQNSFEVLCSFLISQNNNIPRIKGSIEKLCQRFGDKIADDTYNFPTVETLSRLEKNDLQGLGLGYRDEYILDCANKVASGAIDLSAVSALEMQQARDLLRTIKGVGPKVAECVLLFGFYRVEAFPIDTWIKKVLATYYKDGFPKQAEKYAGIAQQYLFHYIKTCKELN